jgi:hypothetical protein
LAFEGRQAACGAESFDRGGDGRFSMFAPGLKYTADHSAVVGRSNLDWVAVLDPFTIEEKSMGCDWSGNHL